MSNIIFSTPATLTSIKSRVDKSYMLTFNTQELDPLAVGEISQLLQVYGTLAFVTKEEAVEDDFNGVEAPEEVIEPGRKSEAQHTADMLFAISQQIGKDYHDLYHKEMKVFQAYLKRKYPRKEQ